MLHQFGPVQQIQLDENNKDGVVYIKFESVMSALNVSSPFYIAIQQSNTDVPTGRQSLRRRLRVQREEDSRAILR